MARSFELGALRRKRASRLAFAMIHVAQDEPLEYMAAALGLTLKALCEAKRLSPQDIMTAADNMLKTTGLEDDAYVTALINFMKNEVPN